MRCLYCGKELALLKRLTGGGDFCSEAHKQSYQEEYNRLALSRLLQAQKKAQQAHNTPVQNPTPAPTTPVAVEEPSAEDSVVPAIEAPVVEVAATGIDAGPSMQATAMEEPSTEAAVQAEEPVGAEPEFEPSETAGFLLDNPAFAALPD